MFLHSKDPSKDLALFEIRLTTHGLKNTVLVKGNDAEVENVPFQGVVKLLTKLDLHVRRIRLVLTGDQEIEYDSTSHDGLFGIPVSERNCVARVVWTNLITLPEGELHYGDYTDLVTKHHSVDLLARKSHDNSFTDLAGLQKRHHGAARPDGQKRPAFHKTKSQPLIFKNTEPSLVRIPQAGTDGTPCPEYAGDRGRGHSYLLPKGNYTLPFLFHLPANMPESVEGLDVAKIRYKLECLVERGRFDRAFKKAMHVRIVRTLHPLNINRYDSIDFANTWPGKIDFKVSVPRKGIALGSSVPIKLVIVPLTKGLSFKSMYAEIVQNTYVTGFWGRSPGFEHVIGRRKVACPNPDIGEDCWQIQGTYEIPCSLSEITQSCTIKKNLISVKHRLRVGIHMRNLDGHVSELRAILPVVLHMSPSHGRVTTRHVDVDANGHFIEGLADKTENVIFPDKEHRKRRSTSLATGYADGFEVEEDEDSAPPVYSTHQNDTFYDYTSAQSPIAQLRANSVDAASIDGYFDILPQETCAEAPIPELSTLLKIPCYEEAIEEELNDYGEEPAPRYVGDSVMLPRSMQSSSAPASAMRPLIHPRSSSMSNLLLREQSSPGRRKHVFMRNK